MSESTRDELRVMLFGAIKQRDALLEALEMIAREGNWAEGCAGMEWSREDDTTPQSIALAAIEQVKGAGK